MAASVQILIFSYFFFPLFFKGWVLCREEGKAIADLAARDDKPLDGFGFFGIVKEIGVDDAGEFDLQFNWNDNIFPFVLVISLWSCGFFIASRFGWIPITIFSIPALSWWTVSAGNRIIHLDHWIVLLLIPIFCFTSIFLLFLQQKIILPGTWIEEIGTEIMESLQTFQKLSGNVQKIEQKEYKWQFQRWRVAPRGDHNFWQRRQSSICI